MPNDNTIQPATVNDKPVASTPPPILEDVVLPPMVGGEPSKSLPTDPKPAVNTGSAAPANDIVMPTTPITSTPRKKFAGGKVIATILGLFLLVGGTGAGIYLVGQNQNVNEQAAQGSCGSFDTPSECGSSCSPTKQNGKSYECKWSGVNNNCTESGQECGGSSGGGTVPTVPTCKGADNIGGTADDTGIFCAGCGGFCLSGTFQDGGCIQAEQIKCPGSGGGTGQCSSITGPVTTYYCEGKGVDTSLGCQENDQLPSGVRWDATNKRIVGSFCGTVQVDQNGTSGSGLLHCSLYDESGCSSTATTPPSTPSISASCQNVKAYSSTWTLLTAAQLSALRTGNTVNFCVAGAKTGGSFTKAKFTINSVAQAETTTVRPSSTDFCQLYTIPANTTTFNVTSQIFHSTLGWK